MMKEIIYDVKTGKEEIKELVSSESLAEAQNLFKVETIKDKLQALDAKLPREVEDLIKDNNLITNKWQEATISEKEKLRLELAELEV